MSVNMFNAEGYADPTTYEALTNIDREEKAARKAADSQEIFRPLVYVCSPFRGEVDRNIKKARKYCRFALNNNAIPMAPHLLYPQFMDDNNPEERYLATHTINYVLLGKCSEVWVFGENISEGMAREITLAEKRRMKIRYFTEELEEIQDEGNRNRI